ncbi:hypothetical protein HY442_00775 [Candidatus Parcubacteria bacterium]|nr:hypothetical protein [Candidatus Parcubacteria bacterium]
MSKAVVTSILLIEGDARPTGVIRRTETEPEDFGKIVGQFESDSRWEGMSRMM